MYLVHLMGYDYNIQYRSGNTNVVADALSRLSEGPSGTLSLLLVPCLTFLEELKTRLAQDPEFSQFRQAIVDHPDEPSSWGKLLRWVEWSYNTSWHSSSSFSPYKITFGKKTFNYIQYLAGDSNIDVVDDMLIDREAVFAEVKKKMEKAQAHMRHFADTKHNNVQFMVGDLVLVKLKPHRQTSVSGQPIGYSKLAKIFYGPFQVIEKIGLSAYKLQLPAEARIHLVFHCSLLKPFHSSHLGDNLHITTLPMLIEDDHLIIQPLAILNTCQTADSKLEVLIQ